MGVEEGVEVVLVVVGEEVGVVVPDLVVVGVVVTGLVVEPEPPPGTTVGTVEGCWAVFQVAVVGQGVVATAGEARPYAVGPGTMRKGVSKYMNSVLCEAMWYLLT